MPSESCRNAGLMPIPARCQAGRGRPAAAPIWTAIRAAGSWPQLVAGVVNQSLDVDNIFLIPRIEQKFGAPPRPRQVDIDYFLNPAGPTGHDHDLVRKEHRLFN